MEGEWDLSEGEDMVSFVYASVAIACRIWNSSPRYPVVDNIDSDPVREDWFVEVLGDKAEDSEWYSESGHMGGNGELSWDGI